MSVIWHDLECGSYAADLELWRGLAAERGSPILDVGAGTGRVALDLARRGHRVTALDRDEVLLRELARRGGGLQVETVLGDAREFDLDRRFALAVVPMQTIQLLGGAEGRLAFLARARRHLLEGGLLAVAIAQTLELYETEEESVAPVPDICERDGVVYSSQPTAIRVQPRGFLLERRREVVDSGGERLVSVDVIQLDHLTPEQLTREGESVGLRALGVTSVPPTRDYAGSEVVMLGA
jgi:SAM-dependent methyltransferase